jgi:16S rRNA (cytosine967-C5)-methyltransferase
VNVAAAQLAAAADALARVQAFSGPADQAISSYFRTHRRLGQRDRAFVAEAVFGVLRRRRSLEAMAGSAEPVALVVAALLRILGYSGRSLQGLADGALVARLRAARVEDLPDAVQADLPDWAWERLCAQYGRGEAMRIAQGLANPAPLDLRVNLARIGREEALERLAREGFAGKPAPLSPSGIRVEGKPPINRSPLFEEGLIEVQDEGSQLLAWLLAPRRGEMVADYCAGAGGKTLAAAMLMRGSGRLYAMDTSARRLAALAPRAARAGVSSIHPLVLSGDNDPRVKRLSGKLDRVLVDAPCSGFGTLRRNPDLKWRHGPEAVAELAAKQRRILESASRLVKPGGRLVYATCSILQEENEDVATSFLRAHPEYELLSCRELLAAQHIQVDCAEYLRLWPHRQGTDGFFAAAFRKRLL